MKGEVKRIKKERGYVFEMMKEKNEEGKWVKVVKRMKVRIKIKKKNNEVVMSDGGREKVKINKGYNRKFDKLWRDMKGMVGIE